MKNKYIAIALTAAMAFSSAFALPVSVNAATLFAETGTTTQTAEEKFQAFGSILYDNSSILGTSGGATVDNVVTLDNSYNVAIWTYHWQTSGDEYAGAEISLVSQTDNKVYGPWKPVAGNGQGGKTNVNWFVFPSETIPAGTYILKDSNTSTWSVTSETGGKGMCIVRGVKAETATVQQPSTGTSGDTGTTTTTDTTTPTDDFWDGSGNYGSDVKDSSLPVPDIKNVEISDGSVDLTWTCSGSDDIEGYYIYRTKDGRNWDKLVTIDDPEVNDYEDKDVALGDMCGYRITSFTSGDESEQSVPAYTLYLKKIDIKSVKSNASKKIQVKWGDVNANITGYEIRVSTTKSFTKTTTITAKASSSNRGKTISKLKGGKKYYVQVRAYRNYKGDKYVSDWSLMKTVKVMK